MNQNLAAQPRPSTEPKVVAVVHTFNGARFVEGCLGSLRANTHRNLDVIVVDSASTDGCPDIVEEKFPEVRLVRNPVDAGPTVGNNVGFRIAIEHSPDYVLVLNEDTVTDPHMIEALVKTVRAHSDRVAASPKFLYMRQPGRLWFAWGRARLAIGLFTNPAKGRADDGSFDEPRETEHAPGCCLLIPRRMLETVGGFDEGFFMGCEDVDWCLRARKLGFRILYAPQARLEHYVSPSVERNPQRMRYLMTRNHLWIMRRHANRLQFMLFLATLPARSALRIARASAGGQWRAVAAEIRGVWHGLFGRVPQAPKSDLGFATAQAPAVA